MRPDTLNFLFSDVRSLSGVGDKLAGRIKELCNGTRIVDVLFHLPVEIRRRVAFSHMDELVSGTLGILPVKITEHIVPKLKRLPYRVRGTFDSTEVELVFFHYYPASLQKNLPVGEVIYISGKIEWDGENIKIIHPDYMEKRCENIPLFEPVYSLTQGISIKMIQKIMAQILAKIPNLPEWDDIPFMQKQGFLDWKNSLIQIHQPHQMENEKNRQRLAYDELLANQLALLLARHAQKKQKGVLIPFDETVEKQFLTHLPFSLTKAQIRVLVEIKKDISSGSKMVRLLQGDVGSGKTIVAFLSLLQNWHAGFQGVFMAPTDLLARQHFDTLSRWCEPMGIRIALLTGREKGKNRDQILSDIKNNKINVLIGTHAVFVEDILFPHLGFIVIDEQHRFGVEQRLVLSRKFPMAHVLAMTATPIPRSLALTLYGDMDISILDEKPVGRKAIETRLISFRQLPQLLEKIKDKTTFSCNEQIYWVCPLVSESEKSDLTAAEQRYKSLHDLLGDRVGLIHGQMKSDEKKKVMADFVAGRISVLVATTVIEVGVDVPSANIMIVEHAERFGLAALHQLRGRVGRGQETAHCLLLHADKISETARERLQTLRQTNDGFVIAEADLKLRGAGDLLGLRQSGQQSFKMVDLSRDADLLYTATKDAEMILSSDRLLQSERGQALRTLLYLFEKEKSLTIMKAG